MLAIDLWEVTALGGLFTQYFYIIIYLCTKDGPDDKYIYILSSISKFLNPFIIVILKYFIFLGHRYNIQIWIIGNI